MQKLGVSVGKLYMCSISVRTRTSVNLFRFFLETLRRGKFWQSRARKRRESLIGGGERGNCTKGDQGGTWGD